MSLSFCKLFHFRGIHPSLSQGESPYDLTSIVSDVLQHSNVLSVSLLNETTLTDDGEERQ